MQKLIPWKKMSTWKKALFLLLALAILYLVLLVVIITSSYLRGYCALGLFTDWAESKPSCTWMQFWKDAQFSVLFTPLALGYVFVKNIYPVIFFSVLFSVCYVLMRKRRK